MPYKIKYVKTWVDQVRNARFVLSGPQGPIMSFNHVSMDHAIKESDKFVRKYGSFEEIYKLHMDTGIRFSDVAVIRK